MIERMELEDRMEKERIELFTTILVVNICGYIGSFTKSEIEYAKPLSKEIIYYIDLLK